jgi:hypothetical protein
MAVTLVIQEVAEKHVYYLTFEVAEKRDAT